MSLFLAESSPLLLCWSLSLRRRLPACSASSSSPTCHILAPRVSPDRASPAALRVEGNSFSATALPASMGQLSGLPLCYLAMCCLRKYVSTNRVNNHSLCGIPPRSVCNGLLEEEMGLKTLSHASACCHKPMHNERHSDLLNDFKLYCILP